MNYEFVSSIAEGKKEYEIRKTNKNHISKGCHILYVDPEYNVPLALVYVEDTKMYELLEHELLKETTNGIQLISRMLNDGMKIDRKTRDFVRQYYYNETTLIAFKIKFLQRFNHYNKMT